MQTVATDGAGKTGTSTIVNVTVPVDSTLPGAPGTPVASNLGPTSVTLTWAAATDDRGVAGYRILRNATVLPGTVTGTTFADSNLTARDGVPVHRAGGGHDGQRRTRQRRRRRDDAGRRREPVQ